MRLTTVIHQSADRRLRAAAALVALGARLVGVCAAAPNVDGQNTEPFGKKVQPIFVEHCHQCHSHSADKIKGGLVVDSLSGLLTGGDSGPAIVPGDPEKSLLIKAVRYTDDELRMPPSKAGNKKLTEEEITVLTEWVKLGAPWPGQSRQPARQQGKITDEDRVWWAFQPLQSVQPPIVDDGGWCRNDLDRFILERLQAEGLRPSREASRPALIRRVYFDLWGLPPSPGEVDDFVADRSPHAYERLIERLLSSPRYGERWARHWLDLVRYAESDGYRVDDYRPHAWRYRDYVIRAFNDDKPYDRFVLEQLAGDEIAPQDKGALAATSFLRLWIYEYNNRDARGQWSTILNDITDTTGDVFLGLGIQCARCHDHKFDPILQRDYYRLQAFFAPILPKDDMVIATDAELADYTRKLVAWEQKTAELRKLIAEIEQPYLHKSATQSLAKLPEDLQALVNKPVAERTPLEHQIADLAYRQVLYQWERLGGSIKGEDKEQWLAWRRKLAEFDAAKPKPLPVVYGVTDVGNIPPPTFVPKGKAPVQVEPGFPTILDDKPARVESISAAPNSTGRRTALARWLTQSNNPLTTRVIVNRIWQYHFGRGLVTTSSDFGRLGEKPSHPELLDWLARRFVQDGWSFKTMHRLILTSATYRQGSVSPMVSEDEREKRGKGEKEQKQASPLPLFSSAPFRRAEQSVSRPAGSAATGDTKDPENRLLWRMNSRRLEAEQIRDAVLAVTGELTLDMGGPSVEPSKPRRTIYTKVMRNTRDPLLDTFDLPESFTSTSQRNVTTTASQSLLMINSQIILLRAQALAERLRRENPQGDDAALVVAAYRLAYGRDPESQERATGLSFLQAQAKRLGSRKPEFDPVIGEKMPYREGKAAVLQPSTVQEYFEVPDAAMFPKGDFTIEAFALLRSLYEDASVRTIASHWNGKLESPGWAFGVTSKRSARKPQTLVLQYSGKSIDSGTNCQPIFSDLHISLNKPYYVAAAATVNDTNDAAVTFYAKDLSNDDEPMQVAHVRHQLSPGNAPQADFMIGARGSGEHLWDGLIDDVRLSRTVLRQEQLLPAAEGINNSTVGFWQFESKPNAYFDSTPNRNHIKPRPARDGPSADPRNQALADFCHVLLNSNEFLYVD